MKTLEPKEFSFKSDTELEENIFEKSSDMISSCNEANNNQVITLKEDNQKDEILDTNIILDDKVIRMILHRSKKAEKYGTAVLSMKEAINRHWQELEELRRNKEQEEMKSSKYLKGFVQKVYLKILLDMFRHIIIDLTANFIDKNYS